MRLSIDYVIFRQIKWKELLELEFSISRYLKWATLFACVSLSFLPFMKWPRGKVILNENRSLKVQSKNLATTCCLFAEKDSTCLSWRKARRNNVSNHC